LSPPFSWETATHSMLCGREHCCDAETTHLTTTIQGFSLHSITQSLEHFKVKLLVNILTLWYEFKVDKPFDVKEADQHGFHIWFDLPCLFCSWRWCTFPLTWLLLCLRVVFVHHDSSPMMILDKKSGSVFSLSFISRHISKWLALWSSKSKWGTNFTATHFTWSSSVKICWHELYETPVNASNSLIVQQRSNIIILWIFLNVFVGSACWRMPRLWLVFKWHVTTFELKKPFINSCLAQSVFFESLSKHCDSFCCCFPQKETKPRCKRIVLLSLPLKNRRKQWQRLKKKITWTI